MTNIEWVAQVSLLRPGFLLAIGPAGIPRSQKRDLGHPLKGLVAALFWTKGSEVKASLCGSSFLEIFFEQSEPAGWMV